MYKTKTNSPIWTSSIFNTNTIELTMLTSYYLGLGLALCYMLVSYIPVSACTTAVFLIWKPTYNIVNKRTRNIKFLLKNILICSAGSRPPIWLEVVTFFLCWSWHQNSVKKIVNWVTFKNDLLIAEKNVTPKSLSCQIFRKKVKSPKKY